MIGGGSGSSVAEDLETSVERGDLVDLDGGQRHLLGQRDEMVLADRAESILDQVQVLDQEVAAPGHVPEQPADRLQRIRVDDASLGERRRMTPARAGMEWPRSFPRFAGHEAWSSAGAASPEFKSAFDSRR